MGDRGNIVLRYDDGGTKKDIYLYSHWGGSKIAKTLQSALAKRMRWDDPIYLGRIIFDELIGNQQGKETGFGLSPYMGDNEHDLLIVYMDEQRIEQVEEDETIPVAKWTFEEFVKSDFKD